MSQAQLATATFVSKSTVAMVETCQRTPTKDFAVAADKALGTDGRFQRMLERLLRAEVTPEWFRPWVDYEREAVEIRWYEPLLIPGLLQIEEYARAVLRRDDMEQTDSMVAARLERQEVIERASVAAIIEEGVLRRQMGGQEVMNRQLKHLASVRSVVHILPTDTETNRHLDGSFALAVVDGTEIAYVDTPARGFVLDHREVVSHVRQRWEILAAEALPRRQSRELILRVAEEQWKTES